MRNDMVCSHVSIRRKELDFKGSETSGASTRRMTHSRAYKTLNRASPSNQHIHVVPRPFPSRPPPSSPNGPSRVCIITMPSSYEPTIIIIHIPYPRGYSDLTRTCSVVLQMSQLPMTLLTGPQIYLGSMSHSLATPSTRERQRFVEGHVKAGLSLRIRSGVLRLCRVLVCARECRVPSVRYMCVRVSVREQGEHWGLREEARVISWE
jgi:hypothetical protein